MRSQYLFEWGSTCLVTLYQAMSRVRGSVIPSSTSAIPAAASVLKTSGATTR